MRESLEILKEKVERRTALKLILRNLQAEKETLSKELFSLKIDAHNEQVDVDTLNTFSLKNVFYAMTGKKEDLLEKERSEARAAKEKYNAATFHFDQVLQQIDLNRDTILSLHGCEAVYWQHLQNAMNDAENCKDVWIQDAFSTRLNQLIQVCESVLQNGCEAIDYSDEVQKTLLNVRDWNRHLPDASWHITMPGYLGGAMMKIENFRKQIQMLMEDLEVLPLPSRTFDNTKDIFVFPENYFRELTGRIGASERLNEADNAIVNAVKRIKCILQDVESVLSELKKISI